MENFLATETIIIELLLIVSLVALAERELLRVMTFGVVLFTLLEQGTTMQFLMTRLGLGVAPALELEYERRHGRLIAAQSALGRIEELINSFKTFNLIVGTAFYIKTRLSLFVGFKVSTFFQRLLIFGSISNV